jgi:hypothetical protein
VEAKEKENGLKILEKYLRNTVLKYFLLSG